MQFIVNKFPHISLDKLIDNKNEPFIQMLVHVDPSDLCLPIGDNIDHSLDVYFEDYENTHEMGHDKSFESARLFETKSQNRDIFSKRASMSARNLSNINKFLIRESNVSDQVVESNKFLSNRNRSLSAKELRTEIQVTLQRLARMEVKSLQENSNHRRMNSEDRVMSARKTKSINKRRIKSKLMRKTRTSSHRKVIKKEELPNNLLQTDARMNNAFSSELYSSNSSTSVNSYAGDENRSRSINESPSFDLLKSTSNHNNNAPLCSTKQNVFKYWLNLHKQLNYVPAKFLNPRTNKHRGSSSLKLRKRRFSVNFNKRLGNFSATTLKRRNLKKSRFSASNKQYWVEKGVKPRGEITATVSTQTINDDAPSVIQYQTQPAMLRGPESDEVNRNNEESIAQEGNNDDEFELNLLDELTISTEEKQIGSTNDDSQQLETTAAEVSNQQVVINSPEGQIFTEQNPLNIEADENIMLTGLTRPSFTRTM